jgi:hypothetical protein
MAWLQVTSGLLKPQISSSLTLDEVKSKLEDALGEAGEASAPSAGALPGAQLLVFR